MGRALAIGYLGLLLLVALLADVLANDRPVLAGDAEGWYAPALSDAPAKENYNWQLDPPIRYAPGATDLIGAKYLPPLAEAKRGKPRHWLGTDRLGRDTAAGLISGTRIAVIVGLGWLVISLLIGVPLGGMAGFFGNDGLRMERWKWWGVVAGLLVGGAYAAQSVGPYLTGAGHGVRLLAITATISVAVLLSLAFLAALRTRVRALRKVSAPPLDTVVTTLIELIRSVPGLVLLIALLALFSRSSLWLTVLVIGLLGWTATARFLRAELLRIRRLPYIEAARVSGIGRWRQLFVHALPAAIGPVVTVSCFLIGGAILTESMLSFLGLGTSTDTVSWGGLLQQSRERPAAWWLAVFPGLLLTLTVVSLNYLGERGRHR